MKIFEKVKSIELEPIRIGINNEIELTFIIEILKEIGKEEEFFPRVYRREFFRIQPTFPQDDNGSPLHNLSDEEILVLDVGEWEQIKEKSVELTIQSVVRKIENEYD